MLTNLIHRDRDFYENGKGKAVSDAEWEAATAGRKKGKHYLDLATKNITHFDAPRSETGFEAGEDNNRHKWFKHFSEALELAQKKQMNQALVTNAFADHFLTDAFSAGHLINKAEEMQKAHKTDKDDKRMDDDATREAFEKRIAHGILADSRGKALYDYQSRSSAWNVVFGGGWHDVDEDALSGVVDMIRYHDEDTFYSMFVKSVHDRLNQDIVQGSGGIRVKNNAGDPPWKLAGDKTLKSSPETLTYAKKAVDAARQALQDAEGKDKLDVKAIAGSQARVRGLRAAARRADRRWRAQVLIRPALLSRLRAAPVGARPGVPRRRGPSRRTTSSRSPTGARRRA